VSYGAAQDKRTIFYARDIHQMNLVLGKFLQKTGAETALLVDAAGHLVARQGGTSPSSEDTITALVAGTFAASQAMAEMLGATEFSSLIPCDDGRALMLLRAGDHALLAVSFTDDVSVPLIRTYALDVIRRIASLYQTPGASDDPEERIQGQRFNREIDNALDDVFG
jgi:predicted regulator of Ras-like GTPase activity (Roadblock/LC7/MglB family)